MAKSRRLVLQHLEDISWQVFKDCPEIISGLIRGKGGVYALYRDDKLHYVGLAGNLMQRLKSHVRNRKARSWNTFSVYLTIHDEHIKELESLLLRIVKPPSNKQVGRFAGSENLRPILNRLLKEAQADRRAAIIRGPVAKRRRKAKALRATGYEALAGYVDRSIVIKGWHKGREYEARLRKDGRIRFRGKLYESPSAAGTAAIRRNVNGWKFWHYKDRGEWVPLEYLRK